MWVHHTENCAGLLDWISEFPLPRCHKALLNEFSPHSYIEVAGLNGCMLSCYGLTWRSASRPMLHLKVWLVSVFELGLMWEAHIHSRAHHDGHSNRSNQNKSSSIASPALYRWSIPLTLSNGCTLTFVHNSLQQSGLRDVTLAKE